MKKDGNVAGIKLIMKRGTIPQQMASSKDPWCTLLPFTSVTGKPICCVIIYLSEMTEPEYEGKWELTLEWKQVRTKDSKGIIDIKALSDPGKIFPGGPSCIYNGNK